MMVLQYIAIGMGGALGAMARVSLSQIFPLTVYGIPCQILCINILGCLAMGFLVESLAFYGSVPATAKSFMIAGFLGGFTTFSAFALEFGLLYEKQQYLNAIFYGMMSVGLSIFGFFTGIKLAKIFF